ncbi:redoxin family protein [Solibacillus sp. FSL K6-1781]|uniref:Glutathione peroxidase n=1 Tax=Solibacillus isronensis B3W22 TaxID=1224748 RepID=K1KHJ3_9BACL|nr:redoxin family protein [Solibacillus isronensis]AMO86038.1 glutathione peroxidase [Solibacillus silvestris]EKB43570.1 Glutathione peroxidase like protein BsaA [Solibacillus isronensis B3W22]
MNIYDIPVKTEKGEQYELDRYKGQVMMIVNTASKCGFTNQFTQLEELYEKYKEEGFVVLGFPSDQFKQELSSGEEAAEFCRLDYGVTFPMHEMVKVNGTEAHPLFKHLSSEAKGLLGQSVKWNFTKFLVDRDGNVIKRYAPQDSPTKAENDIAKLL